MELIKSSSTDSQKLELNSSICSVFKEVLNQPESFSFNFDSLKQFGRLTAPDNSFKIITWNIVLLDGTNFYSGYLQTFDVKLKTVTVIQLIDKAREIENRENSVLSARKWYGGLYYYILRNKVNQIVYYTLLSVRYNDLFTTSKVIEIIYFDEFGNPVFGAPLFNDGKKNKLRVVFEYSANVAMNLSYKTEQKLILFDHLSPEDSRFTGQYQNYGPDLSFDGYQFKNNRWQLISDIKMQDSNQRPSGSKPKRTPVSNKIIR